MTTPLRLFLTALVDYRTSWKLLSILLLIVILPVALLTTYAVDPSGDTTFAAYLTFAQLAMNVALTYAIIRLVNERPRPSIRESYYKGSAVLIRLVLLSFVLVLMLLPLILGLVILFVGVIAPGQGLGLVEKTLLTLLAVAIAVPSLILITRSVWALFVIFETPQGPIEAVKTAMKLSRGKTRALLGRLLALPILMALVLFIPVLAVYLLQAITHWSALSAVQQIVISLPVLPITNFYLYRLHRELGA